MLRFLAQHSNLPVPAVLHEAEGLLVMEYVPGESHFTAASQEHAAELLASLHQLTAVSYGLAQDTLIGGLHQPNLWMPVWLDFSASGDCCIWGRGRAFWAAAGLCLAAVGAIL